MARTSTKTVAERIAIVDAQHARKVMLIETVAKLEENYRVSKAALDEDLKAAIKMAKRDATNTALAAMENQVYEPNTNTEQEMI